MLALYMSGCHSIPLYVNVQFKQSISKSLSVFFVGKLQMYSSFSLQSKLKSLTYKELFRSLNFPFRRCVKLPNQLIIKYPWCSWQVKICLVNLFFYEMHSTFKTWDATNWSMTICWRIYKADFNCIDVADHGDVYASIFNRILMQ